MENLYKILIIDLANKEHNVEYIDTNISNFYMGGYGLALYWLNNNRDYSNPWMIFTSSIIDYSNPINKYIIMAKDNSYRLSYANMGGDFSDFLKSNDYDGLVLVNKANEFLDIYIETDEISYKKAYLDDDYSNTYRFNNLKKEYGDDISSLYITDSTIRGDKISRLINNKYRGCSKSLPNILFDKNIGSITIKYNKKREIDEAPFYLENSNRRCSDCIMGCYSKKSSKKSSIFSKKDSYNTDDMQKLNKIINRLDEYGIDAFALSKSIEFSYTYLNHIYDFKSLNIDQIDYISKNIVKKDRPSLYKDLAQGRGYLEKKYNINPSNDKKTSSKSSDYMKIIDSAGICLFALKPKDLTNIVETINKASGQNYSQAQLVELINEIEKMQRNLS